MTKVGDRVKLIVSSDAYTMLDEGEMGTVRLIDDVGTVHVAWDNGSTLGLVPDEDRWQVLDQSWAAEVQADSSGEWAGNGLRFSTEQEAETYVADLKRRWTLVHSTRTVRSDDPVTHEIVNGVMQRVGAGTRTMQES